MTRRIFFLTAIRSEYDILSSVIQAVNETPGLEPGVIVAGAHLSERFGLTVREIEADGWPIVARLDTLLSSDSLTGRIKGAGLEMIGLADVLANQRPDFLVVMGDREDAIIGAITAAYHHVPVVHIGGGDHADDGNIDNLTRHATTKFAHLHMCASDKSAARIARLGEESWRIHAVGAPGLDRLLNTPPLERGELNRRLGMEDWGQDPYVLVIQHATITDFHRSRQDMAATLEAIGARGVNAVIIHPNSDPGNAGIVAEIDKAVASSPRFRAFRNLPRLEFVNLMRGATLMIGNSSSGIIEAPLFGIPTINVGQRQRGREHADTVLWVDPNHDEIRAALDQALDDQAFRTHVAKAHNPYGDGTAGRRIADVLSTVRLDDQLMRKQSTV